MTLILNLMIFLPLIGGLICLAVPMRHQARVVALGTSIITFVMSLILLIGYLSADGSGIQFACSEVWIGAINAKYATGADFDPGLANNGQCLQPVVVGARSDDLGVKFARGVQVVVVD